METKNLAELYDLGPLEWSRVTAVLDRGITQAPDTGGPNRHTCWLATLNADGSPHVTGIGALWHDGAFWFETGHTTRKGRNVARDPRCSLSVSTHEHDLTAEGTVEQVTDPGRVAEVARLWADGGWPCEVDETGIQLTAPFSAPSAGAPPWQVYRLTVREAFAVECVEPGGATRWTF